MATPRAPRQKKTSYRSGATLIPMRSSESTRDFILEQLSGVRGLLPKAMFGGLGLYAGDIFFGIVARDGLYLKVDDSNRGAYEAAGMAPFKPYADRPMTMHYWQVPAGVLEDEAELLTWAKASIAVARAAPAKSKKAVARKVAGKAVARRPARKPGRKRSV